MRYADPEPIRAAVRGHAEALRAARPEVRALRWFGSWVNGTASADSGVDLCVIVDRSDKARRDRIPDCLPRRFPVGIDLLIFTEEEFAKLRMEHPSLAKAIDEGVAL